VAPALVRLVVGVVLALAWTTAAIGADEKPRAGGELVFVVPSEPPSYDGHAEGTFGVVHPLAPHYNTLLRVDSSDRTGSRVVPDVAESWTVSRDGLTYALRLRAGVRFHDGSVMTSRDVKATYDRIISPPPGLVSYRKGQYRVVEAVEAPDPSTVRFHLKWPEASFLMTLASPYGWIYKADILARDPRWYATNVMGTGPFKFVEHVKGSHWIGRRNPTTGSAANRTSTGIGRSSSARARPRSPRSAGSAPTSSSAGSVRPSATRSCNRSARRSPCRRARGTACCWSP
jgi:peptide/nickel transport system substrate-binding protein